MPPDTRLNFLTELREAAGLSQADVARRFGLNGRQSYKSVAAWEHGDSRPNDKLRSDFIDYLWDNLGLRKAPIRFAEYWETLVEQWHWAPLSDAERAKLHLPSPARAPAVPLNPAAPPINARGTDIAGNVHTGGDPFVGRDNYTISVEGGTLLHQFSQRYLQAHDTVDAAELEAQVTEYLEWLEDSTRNIELSGIPAHGNVVYLALDQVFVPLSAELADQRQSQAERAITLDQVLAVGERLAVIGGPGSGKSTVLQYIAWVLATALLRNDATWAEQKLGLQLSADNPLPPLPLYLPLSAYARLRFHSGQIQGGQIQGGQIQGGQIQGGQIQGGQIQGGQIQGGQIHSRQSGEEITFPEFIQRYLKQSHCNIAGLPVDFFARLLKSGRSVILLLDGLDEVADEIERDIVTQTIENLVTGRKQIRAVVTCRSVAYKGQAILTRGFRQINVNPLDSEHVESLVRQAYAAVYATNLDEQATRAAELLAGIDRLEGEHARRLNESESRLINSPLLVRMLLVVHLNDRKLPQHRADLYRRFVDTMLTSGHVADRTVAGALSTLSGNNLALMSHLAFAMHRQGEEQGREIELDTLCALLTPDYAAETATFLQLTHLRGTLVEERNGFYRFLHLAFQEYLAARYLAQEYWRNEGMKPTFQFVAQQTPHSWWREVATLLPGYLREESPLNAKRVISALAALPEWQTLAVDWSPDVQLAAAEIAATATLEWFPDDVDLRQALVQRLLYFFNTPILLNQTAPRLRAQAGRALAALGDPRFRADAWFLPADPMLGFVEIPAGPFKMGSDKRKDKDARDNEAPEHDVTLPVFYIARYPVTVAQFRAFVETTGDQPRDDYRLRNPDNHPVPYVTWYEATRYCQWLDKRLRESDKTPMRLAEKLRQGWQILLPSEAEWEKAARGTEGRVCPWVGSEIDANRANYDATGIRPTSTVGCFPAGATPEGVHDFSGNVWEWTRSLYQAYPYPSDEKARWERERLQIEAVKSSDQLVQRGGSYYSDEKQMRAPRRVGDSPYNMFRDFGFRVMCGVAPRLLPR